MRRKNLRRGAIFAAAFGLGLTGLSVGSAFTAPLASAAGSQQCSTSHNSDTGHGANTGGNYDSTCDGSASGNGSDNGNHTGEPCAGCVGNADDKNPPGQAPDGSDHNKGYECDDNQGVGKTNPAHTGCETTSDTIPDAGCTNPDGCDNNGGGGGGGNTPPADVLGENLERPAAPSLALTPDAPNAVAGETATAAPAVAGAAAPQLAFTGVGSTTYTLAAAAALMILLGAVMLRASRERELA